ncbi:hypothetical protein HaLaN_24235 [Haematococcus lacustris]|uniref:Uncharacterized protein n=1 Tax=Haematococcus lacustris TaxID=44745 RepID=A0A6A0A282_HAELA|nr:hypothetical protein HaLaN_24235 [Haematococcus lacustris]
MDEELASKEDIQKLASLAQLLAHALPAAGIALLGEPATANAATMAHGFSHAAGGGDVAVVMAGA